MAQDTQIDTARLRGELAAAAALVADSTRTGLCRGFALAAEAELRSHGVRFLADFAVGWSDLIDDLDR